MHKRHDEPPDLRAYDEPADFRAPEPTTRETIAQWRGNRRQRRAEQARVRRALKEVRALKTKLAALREGQGATSADLQREAEYLVSLGHTDKTID